MSPNSPQRVAGRLLLQEAAKVEEVLVGERVAGAEREEVTAARERHLLLFLPLLP